MLPEAKYDLCVLWLTFTNLILNDLYFTKYENYVIEIM